MNRVNSRVLSSILRYLKTRPTIESVGIKSYRQLLEKSAVAFKPDPSIYFDSFQINQIPAQWVIPPNADERSIIIYVHGGGYIAGSMNSHKDLASRIALAAEARLLIFDYRLAPENPFPAGLDDVRTVYQWVVDNFDRKTRICLVGDSAGAGLALAMLSIILKQRLKLPACSVLISPWIDLECRNLSHVENARKDPMLSQEALQKTALLYTDKDVRLPLISPINNDFTGVCPMLIQVGENEVLLDDARFLADKIEKTGARVELEIWDDLFHVWHYFARYLSEGQKAIKKIGNFIKKHH